MNRQQQIDAFLKAAHRLAVERLREQPQRASEVRAVITRWRERRGVTRLLARPLDELARAVCADDDRAVALRSTSPIAPLITAEERAALLRGSRDA
jgi:hypothetical protein